MKHTVSAVQSERGSSECLEETSSSRYAATARRLLVFGLCHRGVLRMLRFFCEIISFRFDRSNAGESASR